MSKHSLYKTGDPYAPEQIKDRNGEVVLALCKKCGQAEGDLEPICPVPDVAQREECDHVWDGEPISIDEGAGWSTTCSKCGISAISHSLRCGF